MVHLHHAHLYIERRRCVIERPRAHFVVNSYILVQMDKNGELGTEKRWKKLVPRGGVTYTNNF